MFSPFSLKKRENRKDASLYLSLNRFTISCFEFIFPPRIVIRIGNEREILTVDLSTPRMVQLKIYHP